jgi:hypothetical protein
MNLAMTHRALILFALPLVACGPGGMATTPDMTKPTTFTDLKPVIHNQCANFTSCHSAQGKSLAGIDMLTDPYSALVNAKTVQVAGTTAKQIMNLVRDFPVIVTPGDTSKSALWKKINLTVAIDPTYGYQMPQSNGMLDPSTIAMFQSWILDGAQNN